MKCETAVLQNLQEHALFVDILKTENVRSYLEVGSKFGGSLWRVANALPSGSRIVSVDLPHGDGSFKQSQPPLEECIAALRARGYDAHLLLGDSTDAEIVDKVGEFGPFDACFIDGCHLLSFVTQDWENYGPMCKLVAFHDISWKPRPEPSKKMPIEVPMLWDKIKSGRRHQEIRMEERDNGIGVLWQ